ARERLFVRDLQALGEGVPEHQDTEGVAPLVPALGAAQPVAVDAYESAPLGRSTDAALQPSGGAFRVRPPVQRMGLHEASGGVVEALPAVDHADADLEENQREGERDRPQSEAR